MSYGRSISLLCSVAATGLLIGAGAAQSPGRFVPYGASTCRGSQLVAPGLASANAPELGGTLRLRIHRALPLASTALILGVSDAIWANALPLPFDLAPAAPGCFLFASIDALLPATADATGTAELPVAIPNRSELLQASVYVQGIAADSQANGLGLTTTHGARCIVGAPPASTVDFYGKPITFVKLFGQRRWGDTSPGRVTGSKIFHAAGVLVDRSGPQDRIYVADSGNNRILGFASAPAWGSTTAQADLAFGQPDLYSGAANGDSNRGFYGPTGPDKLCLTAYPMGTNVAEQWMRLNFDVDGAGNLYVPDFYNNRVLMYREPFSPIAVGGRGDAIADEVWGQPDFTTNGVNRGRGADTRDASSLYIGFGGFDHVASRGISVDAAGNLWVADTFNFRVLRFPSGSRVADLVLGAPSMTASDPSVAWAGDPENAPRDRVCTPTLARVHPTTGELYVVDEYPNGFPARILVFTPPFSNGMAASRVVMPRQALLGDYASGYRLTHVTGLIFNTFRTDDFVDPIAPNRRYREGEFWLHASAARALLCDASGNILVAIGAPDVNSYGGSYAYYGRCGQDPVRDYNLNWSGGMMGVDSANRLYLADDAWSRVTRYALPYGLHLSAGVRCMPDAEGGMFGATPDQTAVNSVGPANLGQDNVGVAVYQNQLIARDHQRYLVWNDYLAHADGAPADVIVGQPSGSANPLRNHIMGRSMHAIDHAGRIWMTGEHGRILCWQLPFTPSSAPLRELISLYWADTPSVEVAYHCGIALAFEPAARALWVADSSGHRLLRVRIPNDVVAGTFLVDAVLGQNDRFSTQVNRGMAAPDAASLGDVNDLEFDRMGNLFVVDNTYECHRNGRVLGFLANDLASIATLFPGTSARLLYVTERFDQTDICRGNDPVHGDAPFSPVCIAFNSRNEMIVGNDGYYRDPRQRLLRQLYLYRTPLAKATPDAVIELPLGAPGEIAFDASDRLIVQDHTWNKVWILDFTQDPIWLRPLP